MDEAQYRLNEIIFCNLFQHLLKKNRNPVKVYNMIEVMASVAGANIIILNNVINIILTGDHTYIADRKEIIATMKACNLSVRKIIKRAGMSMSTYYKYKDEEMVIKPRFSPAQYNEMMKILNLFNDLYEELDGYDEHCIYESSADNVSGGI